MFCSSHACFGVKHLDARAHLARSPAVPGLNAERRHPSTDENGVCGRPPLWPAGDPAAEGAACVRPVASPPVRRPDARCRGPSSVVCRQVRRFGRACRMPPRGRRAGAGRFGVRPRPGGRMRTGARCRRVRDSFLSGTGSPKTGRPLCRLPPRIIHDPEGNRRPERDNAPEPVSWSGRAAKGRSCGFFGKMV